jgi:hypothetical protein
MMTSVPWGAFCSIGSHHHYSHDQGWSTACGGWWLHCSILLARYADLIDHYSICQVHAPLTGNCSTVTCMCLENMRA